MHASTFPNLLRAPTAPGAIPCFMARDAEPPRRARPIWDERCARILARLAAIRSNAEIADCIAIETGMRFKEKTVSERRSALGFDSPRQNDWTAPLRRYRPWQS